MAKEKVVNAVVIFVIICIAAFATIGTFALVHDILVMIGVLK